MEKEMIKWVIDNLKPPYYDKMIGAQVTHFASLIPIGERIDEDIKSKKNVDPKALISMIEHQVEKAIRHKGKKVNVHMVNNRSTLSATCLASPGVSSRI